MNFSISLLKCLLLKTGIQNNDSYHKRNIDITITKEYTKQNQLIINQNKMKTIKKINYVVALVMITATLMFTASCKKENLSEPNNLSATNEDAAKRSAS